MQDTPNHPSLPDKTYFKIGEVSEIVGVKPYVLRYWESEFPALRPTKSSKQQRLYRKKDIETLQKIKHLLYVEKFTIAGAKRRLHRLRANAGGTHEESSAPSQTVSAEHNKRSAAVESDRTIEFALVSLLDWVVSQTKQDDRS